jgi:hypothetical protein
MFGDIGIGIILSIVFSQIFSIELRTSFVVWGIVFSLLPDIDMLVYVCPSLKKVFGKHRGFSHYPIVYVPVVGLICFFSGLLWALYLGAAVFLHLVHDTFWIGSGITWLWPFSKKSFKFFPQDAKVPAGMHWVKAFYFRPTLVSVCEYGLLIISLIILLLQFV